MDTLTGYYSSPLGRLKIQCTSANIISVLFTDEEESPNENGLINNKAHELFRFCSQQLEEYFAGDRKKFNLPLQQKGTIFQQKVWDLLYEIPYGKTLSYLDLAKKYGDVKAIRAIASANGKNNLAIIVPCHRVIGTNRSLTGYAGGLWRKQYLLELEAKYFSGVQPLSLGW
jgi:methylated-DNA-[protein]-cysteine S-methyltransferase